MTIRRPPRPAAARVSARARRSAKIAATAFCWILSPALGRAQDPSNRPPYATASHTASPAPVATTAMQPSAEERLLFDSVNRERAAQNLQPLQWDAILASAARQHANVMTRERLLSHQYPGEPPLEERAGQAGARFSSIAENIAFGQDAAEIHIGWMNSPGHRKNILNPDVTALGVAVIRKGDDIYAVQDFARSVPNLSLGEQEAKLVALLAPYGLRSVAATDDARKTCTTTSGFSGAPPSAVLHLETPDLSKPPEQLSKTLRSGVYRRVAVGACGATETVGFVRFRFALLLY